MTFDFSKMGSALLAAGMAGIGAVMLATQAPIARLVPHGEPFAAGQALALGAGVASIVAAVGLLAPRFARIAGLILAALLFADIALAHLPYIAAKPASGGRWSEAFITLALAVSAYLASGSDSGPSRRAAKLGYGLALCVFGVVHWLYRDAIAGMIPAWIPGRPWWPWLTGAANLAAGLAMVSGVKARLAALMVGAMFGSWVLLLHIPAVVSEPGSATQWTALAIALGLWGGAWLAAERRP